MLQFFKKQQLSFREVSIYGVFSGPYFPAFGPGKTPYLDIFHTVYVHQISFRNNTLYKFNIKIYLELFVSIYPLNHLFGIIYKSKFYNFNVTLNNWFISRTINIRGNFIWKWPLWDPGIPEIIGHSFSFFSVITIIEITSCIFALKCVSCSFLVPLPFLLRHYIRRYNQMGKWWSDE